MRKLMAILLLSSLFLSVMVVPALAAKSYDLVLVHGLTNKHHWSDDFLRVCLNNWGSGNVYCVYNNSSNDVWTKIIDGKTVYCIGRNDYSAGDGYVSEQTALMYDKVQILQQSWGLSPQFDIIAHSMGGLVARYYIYQHPNTVAGLVTLGTPHHGSPLSRDYDWISAFIGACHAMDNLRPEWCESFNAQYPISGSPMYNSGKIYTIRGDSDGMLWEQGSMGELYLGWWHMTTLYWTDSDGLVPRNSALITGATHIGDFWDYDHLALVTKPSVAEKAAQYLP
ncbi:MAG: lipase family alpha/beta hydrolase [Acidobacteriota bacterium]